jgi:hypothetical protein
MLLSIICVGAKKLLVLEQKGEERYDKEVIRWLRKGKNIAKAIKKANKKYPKEAIQVNDSNINDVHEHYIYLLEHEDIIRKIHH